MNLNKWVRPNILALKPYSSARDEFSGEAMVFLDANENPFNGPYNRYPDPLQLTLKEKIAALKGIPVPSIFLGNGSDEPIDLLIRAFCEPGVHNIVRIDPTYGMYQVAADIHNIGVISVALTVSYQLDAAAVLAAVTPDTRMIFLCSPNNPTGNALEAEAMEQVIRSFAGPVVLDEAYIDFSPDASFLPRLKEFDNLIILQTFSKAWGMAGIRLGMAFAPPEICAVLNKIKYPYNLNILTQHKALELISDEAKKEEWVELLIKERDSLSRELSALPYVSRVWPSDANFLLVTLPNARWAYQSLVEKGIIVRDRSRVLHCENSLRITIGTPEENRILMDALRELTMV